MTNLPAEPPPDVPSVEHTGLPDNVQLLDVREDDEWAEGHAPRAVHIPLGQLESRLDEVRELAGDGRLVVTCKAGGRAARAVAYLRDQGIDAVNLTGGMATWAASNRPMTRHGAGAPGIR